VLALVVTVIVAVALLGVLVAGLLRSHADILRALHSLGAGIGDPLDDGATTPVSTPIQLGRALAPERGDAAPDVAGTTLAGDAVAITPTAAPRTLLAFLSSGCATCARFWAALRSPESLALPAGVRVVVVTKGPELEEVALLRNLAPPSVDVVLSTDAWIDYEVPGAPFFVLLDAQRGRVGEGLAGSLEQVADLVRRATVDGGDRMHVHHDGPAREVDNDRMLRDAGILPGDPSLRPHSIHRP
jgi:hypothetical protein